MRTTFVDRFFGDEPTRDPTVRWGRRIGMVLGLALYPMFVLIVIDGLLRAP